MERFSAAFAPGGFRHDAFYPCYGLAEATVFVAGGRRTSPPVIRHVDSAALEQGQAVSASADAPHERRLVGCGGAWLENEVRIVDPESRRLRPDGIVGEIWVRGPSVAQGYWNRPDETDRTFHAKLEDSEEGPFLRTGDLGFIADGELFITGRTKDVVVIRGRNYYPQDIEASVQAVHVGLRGLWGGVRSCTRWASASRDCPGSGSTLARFR